MAFVTPDELSNKSPGEIITLYLNRANSTDFQPSQLDLVSSERAVDEEGEYIQVIVEPRKETGWVNGPITVKLPLINVGDYYQGKVIPIAYKDVSKLNVDHGIGTYLRELGAPPSRALTITEGELDDQEDPSKVTLTFFAEYHNIFLTGHLPIKVIDVPKVNAAVKMVKDIFLNPKNLN